MLFPTVDYALFFLLIFGLAWMLRSRLVPHKALLLIASYVFYGFSDWRFVPLLAGISLVAAWAARRIQVLPGGRARKAWLVSGVTVCLATLAAFKYVGFVADSLVSFVNAIGIPWSPAHLPELALPVGISFFVFHAISLMADTWRGKVTVRVTFLDALLYVAFFPQLVAGPILRASSFLPQLAEPRDPRDLDAARAIELIVLGLVKKVIVANFLATHLVDAVFEAPARHGALEALFAAYGYAAQIYCDFSGYTDIAIGSALLLGYQFPQNFDRPYLAKSPQEFWHRWHMSLSSWLRDYLYIALGGSRQGRYRTHFNLAFTMVLGGLWHGAAWTFVAWGALHGVGLVVHRLWSAWSWAPVVRLRASPIWSPIAGLLTFHFVCLCWILFRASSFELAWQMVRTIARPWSIGPWLTAGLALALGAGLLGQAIPERLRAAVRGGFAHLPFPIQGSALALAIILLEAFGPSGVAPFIYFRF